MSIVKGKVILGEGRGEGLGYPTANLDRRYYKLHPVPKGVYAAWTAVGAKRYPSLVIIGAPSRKKKKDFKIEIHVLGVREDFRGLVLEARLVKRLRSLQTYPDETRLVAQIQEDIYQAKNVLKD
ncbi:MAG: riboflavin kinase [Patescibacteria group bacterium]|nr:riboflavin kinase [Patescibacteria group bacterium]